MGILGVDRPALVLYSVQHDSLIEGKNMSFYKLKRTDLDLIAQADVLSRNAIKLFYWLGDRVTDRNKCSVDTKDISDHFKIDRTGVSKLIKELEDGLLIVVEWKQGTGRIIACHPHHYWCQDYSLQRGAIRQWYKHISKTKWDSVIKQTEQFLIGEQQ